MKRELSQQEIDDVFKPRSEDRRPSNLADDVQLYDFRRPDRIAKMQVRALHVLHENFVRNLAPDLSAYLRSYLVMNLVTVEQISYTEFLESLPPASYIVSLGLKPYDGSAVLEINPSLVFPILEALLGGTSEGVDKIQREITDIEQSLMQGVVRIILRNLAEAWKAVATIDFSLQAVEMDRHFQQVIAPNEAVVAIGIEMRMGESTGLLNIALPSLIIKMLRQKFDQQWLRKTPVKPEHEQKMLKLVQPSFVRMDAKLTGPKLKVSDLLALEPGDLLNFNYSISKPLECTLNGSPQYDVQPVQAGNCAGVRILQRVPEKL